MKYLRRAEQSGEETRHKQHPDVQNSALILIYCETDLFPHSTLLCAYFKIENLLTLSFLRMLVFFVVSVFVPIVQLDP